MNNYSKFLETQRTLTRIFHRIQETYIPLSNHLEIPQINDNLSTALMVACRNLETYRTIAANVNSQTAKLTEVLQNSYLTQLSIFENNTAHKNLCTSLVRFGELCTKLNLTQELSPEYFSKLSDLLQEAYVVSPDEDNKDDNDDEVIIDTELAEQILSTYNNAQAMVDISSKTAIAPPPRLTPPRMTLSEARDWLTAIISVIAFILSMSPDPLLERLCELEEQGLADQQEYHETQYAYMADFSAQLDRITEQLELITDQLDEYETNAEYEADYRSEEDLPPIDE